MKNYIPFFSALFLLALLWLADNDCFGQDLPMKNDEQQIVIFQDDFSNNKNKWKVGVEMNGWSANVENGKYVIDNPSYEFMQTQKSIPIDISMNFAIECSALWLSGNQNDDFGITFGQFGRSDVNNFFDFTINANGYFRYGRGIKGNYKELIPWARCLQINLVSTIENKIKIKKINSNIVFYINDEKVAIYNFDDFGVNNEIGFIVKGKQKVQFDNLIVTQE